MFANSKGDITLHGIKLSRFSTIEELKAHEIFTRCQYRDIGIPNESVVFPVLHSDKKEIEVIAFFHDGIIKNFKILDLTVKSEEEWDEIIEKKRQKNNEFWFTQNSELEFKQYDWGWVESTCSEENGYALIEISYSD